MKQQLTNAWYKGSPFLWLLWPLSVLYLLVTLIRRQLYRAGLLRVYRSPVPVIVVGNIAVGGTGKTPLTLALIERLRAAGFKPAVVSRGYGGHTTYPAVVGEASTAAEVGDEPLMMAQRSKVTVVVDPKRPRAVQYLLAREKCDVILCDDGLQHHALARDIEICVVDGRRGMGRGRVMPMGPLREPVSRLRTVDYVVGNGGVGNYFPGVHPMHLRTDAWQVVGDAVDGNMMEPPAAGTRLHGVAGIGHPERFFNSLRAQGYEVIEHGFPDHHAFVPADFQFGDELPVVMTEKDAVKCRSFALANAWYVPVTAELPESFYAMLIENLRRLRVRKKAG
jgi:tetraacyldisaccharide 4'-kinase